MSDENVDQESNAENAETETPEGTTQESWLDTIDPEAKKEVLKLRKEAAAKRVLSKQQEAELEEYRKYKESQMTELEKAQAEIARLKGENVEAQRLKAATVAGLDPDLAEYVRGDSPDEMLESAKLLAEKTKTVPGAQVPGAPRPSDFAGRRGTGVTDKDADRKEAANDMVRDLIRRAR